MKIFEVRIPVTFDLKVEAESREEAERAFEEYYNRSTSSESSEST